MKKLNAFNIVADKRGSIVTKFTRKASIQKPTDVTVRINPIDVLKEKKVTQVKESKAVKAARLDPRHKVCHLRSISTSSIFSNLRIIACLLLALASLSLWLHLWIYLT